MNNTETEIPTEKEVERLREVIESALRKIENAPSNLFTTSKHAIFLYELEQILRKGR